MSLQPGGTLKTTLLMPVDPESATWSYELRTRSDDTYGGRVIQILSRRVTGLHVGGRLPLTKGASGDIEGFYRSMELLESGVKAVMDEESQERSPHRVVFPALGWDVEAYLSSFGQVRFDPMQAAVSFEMSFDVVSGTDGVTVSSSDKYGMSIENVPDGVHWVRNEYNTPSTTDWETVKKNLESVIKKSGGYTADDLYGITGDLYASESEASTDGGAGGSSGTNGSTETGAKSSTGGSSMYLAQKKLVADVTNGSSSTTLKVGSK